MCIRLKQQQIGLASVEAVLILPLLLFIIAIMFTFTKAMMLKQEVIIEARTMAWRKSLFGNVPCIDNETRNTISFVCSEDTNSGRLFLQSLVDAGTKKGSLKVDQVQKMVNVITDAQQPRIIAVLAKTQITPLANILQPFQISARYAVDRKVFWPQEELPLGYDEVLYKEFMHKDVNNDPGSSRLFPGFFPNVGKKNDK